MASLDDVVSTLQGITRNLGIFAKSKIGLIPVESVIGTGTLTTTSIQVLAAGTGRSALVFHNPSTNTTTFILVAPATDTNGNAISATFASPGGGFLIPPQQYISISGSVCALAWNGVAQTATTALTIGIS
jgi:hypothetical protein